jgi:hypothetical protein
MAFGSAQRLPSPCKARLEFAAVLAQNAARIRDLSVAEALKLAQLDGCPEPWVKQGQISASPYLSQDTIPRTSFHPQSTVPQAQNTHSVAEEQLEY